MINSYHMNVVSETRTQTLIVFLREDNLVIPHENVVDKKYSELKICNLLQFTCNLMFV